MNEYNVKSVRVGCLGLLLVTLGFPGLAQHPGHVVVPRDEVKWGPASPKLPPGAQFARIAGDPSKPGEPYVLRAKLPDGYSVPPHWHPMDENVTIIQGTLRLGFGKQFDSASLRDLTAGSFALLPKAIPHFNIMKGETILQFHGIGPYDISYVNATDDPSRKSGGNQGPSAARLN